MKRIFYILILFKLVFLADSNIELSIENKYQLAQDYRNKQMIEDCLRELFDIKDEYLKANFDIASIYYQEYKNYDIALEFFNFIIKKYESNLDSNINFLEENLNIYKNAIFFSAYIYVNDLELYTKGKKMYELFIEKFSDDELADDAMHELKALNDEINQIEILKNNLK